MPYAEFMLTDTAMEVAEKLHYVTEAAARAAAEHIGRGDKITADRAAVDAMHDELTFQGLSCEVVIGEGEKDNAPELERGHVFGDRRPARYDLAVDPVEGTSFVAAGLPGGMSIAALGEHGSFLPWVGVHYMKKLVVGPGAASLLDMPLERGGVDIRGDQGANMRRVAHALGKPVSELTVAMLDRARNRDIMDAAEQIGARILLLEGGDVTPALQACMGEDVDMLYSSGGAPEGVITAAAVAALGGNMQAKMDPQNRLEEIKLVRARLLGKVLRLKDLIGDGDVYFSATGITDSPLSVLSAAHQEDGVWYPGKSISVSRPSLRANGHRRVHSLVR